MPSHLYSTKHVPPKLYDIILAHALELAIAVFSMIAGFLVFLHVREMDIFATTTPLRFLPVHLLYGLAVFMFAGGATTLVGLLVRRNNIRTELNVEQTGWIILAAGWCAYAWSAITYADGAAMSYIFAGAVTIGCALRAAALFVIEKQLDTAVREGVDTGSHPLQEDKEDTNE